MPRLYHEYPNSYNVIYLDTLVPSLMIDDPQFTFYLGRLPSSQLSSVAGKMPTQSRNHVFISYSHLDSKWLNMLQVHLKPLVRKGTLSTWSDTTIRPGANWRNEIEGALASARVAVLLVTPNFLASDYIVQSELPFLLRAAQANGLRVLWVAVSACFFESSEIAAYQAANDPARPLDSLSKAERNAALVQICKKIHEAAEG